MAETLKSLRRLISLLDDPDETTGLNVMAELLLHADKVLPLLPEYQECSDPVMRKRIHQLQAAIILRSRRRFFLARLHDPRIDFFDLLIDVHLQWYDNDSRPEVEALLAKVFLKTVNHPLNTLEEIRSFMLAENLTAEPDSTLKPENYCIASILSEHVGAASILAAISVHLAAGEFFVARVLDDFAVCSPTGEIMLPARNWQIFHPDEKTPLTPWDLRDILKLAAANLFSAAVNSDSFRYILTISQALSGIASDEILDFLPYPYRRS